MIKAVLIVSHGSRSPQTKVEVQSLLNQLQDRRKDLIFELGFLELENPSIPQGIERCIQRGAGHIAVILNFLNSGRHVDIDIPQIINESRQKHPDITITISAPIGQHPGVVELFDNLIRPN
ncbi:MAG: CbiX/SirB N-terminal domain-containing protein [Candidatus Omnitrophica bacterium]|nr:CbiX/SirB N-terminal domain-containing protein [Candidatus Omnitrophota bacterium]